MSARQFAIDLTRFGEVTDEQAKVIFQKIVIDLDSRIVLDTPVDVGRARGNWFPSINNPSNAVDLEAKDKSGEKSVSRLTSTARNAKLGDTVWFTNNLPYILALENGHSQKQAPDGMVDVNLNAVQAFYGGEITR
jgi:hypothetical protein